MGTTQQERFLNALNASYFSVDERDETDYIEFVQKLSEYVKFYNENNNESGTWESFFQWESTAILVSIFAWDIEQLQKDYKTLKYKILISSENDEIKRAYLEAFFNDIAIKFENYKKKLPFLDSAVSVKEFLLQTTYLISDAINIINILIPSTQYASANILIKSYKFDKAVQQLFGLLSNWKNTSGQSITDQLETYSGHSPHYALFLAFLKLLGIARAELNGFTKRHLDFYYKDVLNIQHQAALPDYVHLIAKPAVINKTHILPKNTIFLGGKDSFDKNRYYASTADFSVNKINLKYFYSAFINNATERRQVDLTALNSSGTPFDVFPDPATDDSPYVAYDIATESGILIASPLFYLSGGDRYIRIKIAGINYNNKAYRFYLTGEKGIIEVTQFTKTDPISGIISSDEDDLYMYLPPDEMKIVSYDAALHTDISINTSYPVLKIVPKSKINKINVENAIIAISVRVRNFKNFILSSDTGALDINKPFYPFGDFPKNGNGITIGCNEFFIKKGAVMKINSDNLVTVQVFKLDDGQWVSNSNSVSSISNTFPLKEYSVDNLPVSNESISGYIRLELNGDSDTYEGENFLKKYIAAAQSGGDLPVAPIIKYMYIDYDVSDSTTLSKNIMDVYELLPFGYQQKSFFKKPLRTSLLNSSVKSVSLVRSFELIDTAAIQSLSLSTGIRLVKKPTVVTEQTSPNSGGELYFGFENVLYGSNINVLFQLAEGTVNPRKRPATIKWQYLKNDNNWADFKTYEIGDDTNGLLESGIVQITVPEDYKYNNITVLPDGLFWVKISVDITDAISNFVGVHDHAFKAVLTDFENSGSIFTQNLPKDTVTKFYQPVDYIKSITQPYPSFGGKKEEDDTLMYRRISERLRHKNRGITVWDYERLILQQFPEVAMIKCLNHYSYNTEISNVSAGYVTIVPVAKSGPYNVNVNWQPLLSLASMEKIKSYISNLASPHARIFVKPPSLEKIRLNFDVKYRDLPGADTRLYEISLINTINQYLSPWAYGSDDIEFVSSVEISSLIQLIDDQPFVDYIVNFQADQLYTDGIDDSKWIPLSNVKKIVPRTDFTLFVPNEVHTIKKINDC